MSWPEVAVVGLAMLVAAAAVVAVAAGDRRVAVLGLAGALALAPLVADPLPDPLVVAIRIVAAALAAYLIRIPLRDAPPGRGSRLGWPAEALAAGAGFVAGWAASVSGSAGDGPAGATAAAAAIGVLVVAPILDRRDPARTGIALLLAVVAADLLRVGLGDPLPTGPLTVAAAIVAVATAVTAILLAGAARSRRPAAGPPGPDPDDR